MKQSFTLTISKSIGFKKQLLTFLASAFFCAGVSYAQHSVSTTVGSSQGFADATGNAAKFKAPTGICISPDGASAYVADYSGHRIRKVNLVSKAVTTVAGNGTMGYANGNGGSAQFSYPSGVCISPDGTTLYVCDYGNGYIRKIVLAGNAVTTIAGDGSFAYADNANGLMASFNGATDLKLLGDSVLFISDTDNQLIRKMNLNTTEVSTFAGMYNVPGFQNGIGLNSAFRLPKGLAVSEDGSTLFVADNGNNMIRAIDIATRTATTIAGNGNPGYADNMSGAVAEFNAPNGVAIVPGDPDVLFVADNSNHRIRQVEIATTAVSTVAGNGAVPPSATFGDHTFGLSAKFFYPTNLAVTPDGASLYVADQGNFRVRKVNTDLNVSGINEFGQLEAEVFPNPATAELTISLRTLRSETLNIVLTDALWKTKFEKTEDLSQGLNQFKQDISSLETGIYFLRLTKDDGSVIKKVVINH